MIVFVSKIMREKANSEVSRGRESDLIDDEDVLMEDDFYTTHSGRQVRRRRSVPDQKTSGWITVKFFPKAVSEALFSGPNDFHPITVALIKINTREVTDILRKNAQRIVSMIEDPERRKKVLSIFELFRFSLHKMTRNLASAQKKEFHEKLVERKMKVHEEAEQPFILDKYTR